MKYILYISKDCFAFFNEFSRKKTSFQTDSSMGGSLGGRELDDQVDDSFHTLGEFQQYLWRSHQVVSWVSAHNRLLARLGEGRPDVKVLSVTKVDSETK